jgi:hypothetical protein
MNILNFRESCAEDGIEITPEEAERIAESFLAFREEIINAVEENPNYYQEVCNKTLEEKLEEIKLLEEREGKRISLREYNDLLKMIKQICELEGLN